MSTLSIRIRRGRRSVRLPTLGSPGWREFLRKEREAREKRRAIFRLRAVKCWAFLHAWSGKDRHVVRPIRAVRIRGSWYDKGGHLVRGLVGTKAWALAKAVRHSRMHRKTAREELRRSEAELARWKRLARKS